MAKFNTAWIVLHLRKKVTSDSKIEYQTDELVALKFKQLTIKLINI